MVFILLMTLSNGPNPYLFLMALRKVLSIKSWKKEANKKQNSAKTFFWLGILLNNTYSCDLIFIYQLCFLQGLSPFSHYF